MMKRVPVYHRTMLKYVTPCGLCQDEALTLHEISVQALWVSGVRGQSLVHVRVFPDWQEV